jgi:SOS-response transcriptional repressor LexA
MLTPRQVKLLDFIRTSIETTGIAPTYAEMTVHMRGTRSNAHMLVDHLVRAGQLKRTEGSTRNLALVAPYRSIIDVPTPVLRAELARREVAA